MGYRDQSWQIEMLIAGSVIFTLYNITDTFRSFFFEVYPLIFTSSNQIVVLFFVYFFSKILLIGFGANLILRGVWLAYLGINFSFRKGINFSKLRQSDYYREQLGQQPNIVQRVVVLERWCNLSYSFAVLLGLFTSSLMLSVSVIIWVLYQFGFNDIASNPRSIYVIAGFLLIVQLGLLDRVLFLKTKEGGLWRRVRNGVSTFLNIITLSFMYNREFLVLRTNVNRWLLYGFSLVYLGVAFLISVNQIGDYYPYGTFNIDLFDEREAYDVPRAPSVNALRYETSLKEGSLVFRGCIQSDIIKERYIRLFLVSWVNFDYYLKHAYTQNGFLQKAPDSLKTAADWETFNAKNTVAFEQSLNDLFKVKLKGAPDSLLYDLSWRLHRHPITREDGYLAYIDTEGLASGKHVLDIDISYLDNEDKEGRDDWLQIQFLKE